MRTFYLLLLCFHCLFAVAHKSSQKLQKQQEQSSSFVTDVEAELKKMFHQVIIEAAKSKQVCLNSFDDWEFFFFFLKQDFGCFLKK